MDYLAQNMEKIALSPQLHEELLSYQPAERVDVRMKSGTGIEMMYRGVSLYHPQQPLEQAALEVQRLQGNVDQDLVVFFGLGFGIHAEFLKKRFNAPLLIFEPSLDILKSTLSLRPLLLDDFTIETNLGRLAEIIDHRLEYSDRRVVIALHSNYRELFPEKVERFSFVVQQAMYSVVIRHNTLKRGSTWARYEIENLRETIQLPPVTELKHFAGGVPGVFVGAGPSLAKNIELLKRLKGKALVFAASTALRPLDKAGVKPDVAMVIESNNSRYQFEGLSWLSDLTLAVTSYSNPDNFKLPVKRRLSLLNHPSPTHDWMVRAYGEVDSVPTAASVALAAFSTLHSIGCNPIIALGMDLAFTDNQTHAAGADSAAEITRYNEEKQRIEYIVENPNSNYFKEYGGPNRVFHKGEVVRTIDAVRCTGWGNSGNVYADMTFTNYRAWLEGAAETWASDRILINATEGGAKIHGFEEMPLAAAMETYAHTVYPIEQWLEEIERTYLPRDVVPLRNEIDVELNHIRRVKQLAEQSSTTATQAIQLIQSNKLSKAQKSLDALNMYEKEMGALTRKTRMLNQIISQAATNIRLDRQEDLHEDMRIQTKNSLNRSIRLFRHIQTGCRQAIQLFELAENILQEQQAQAMTQ